MLYGRFFNWVGNGLKLKIMSALGVVFVGNGNFMCWDREYVKMVKNYCNRIVKIVFVFFVGWLMNRMDLLG